MRKATARAAKAEAKPAKKKALAAIEKLPANATIEDAIERLVFLTKIERGLTEVLQKFCLRSVTPADRGPLHGRSTSDDAPA